MEEEAILEHIRAQVKEILDLYITNQADSIVKLFSDTKSILIGTGQKEVVGEYSQFKFLWKSGTDAETMSSSNIVFPYMYLIDPSTVSGVLTGDMSLTYEGITNTYPFRISFIWKLEGKEWLVKQWHASFPQMGDGDGVGWPTPSGLAKELEELLEKYDKNLNDKSDEMKKIKTYLIDAKNLINSLNTHSD